MDERTARLGEINSRPPKYVDPARRNELFVRAVRIDPKTGHTIQQSWLTPGEITEFGNEGWREAIIRR